MSKSRRGPRGPLEAAFAEQIEGAIQSAGRSMSSVADEVGITVGAISAYCGGHFLPRPEVRVAIERCLNVRFVLNDPSAKVALPAKAAPEECLEGPLTIAEAKRRLATTLGVPESAIEITVRA